MSTTKSIRAYRRLDGSLGAEMLVRVNNEVPTAWQIRNINSRYPYTIVDGHRYDLQTHEVLALRKAVSEVV